MLVQIQPNTEQKQNNKPGLELRQRDQNQTQNETNYANTQNGNHLPTRKYTKLSTTQQYKLLLLLSEQHAVHEKNNMFPNQNTYQNLDFQFSVSDYLVELLAQINALSYSRNISGFSIQRVLLGGGAAAWILDPLETALHYNDIDVMFELTFDEKRNYANYKQHVHHLAVYDCIRDAVVDSLRKFAPPLMKGRSVTELSRAYIDTQHRFVCRRGQQKCWSIYSVNHRSGRFLDLVFIHQMQRRFTFLNDALRIEIPQSLLSSLSGLTAQRETISETELLAFSAGVELQVFSLHERFEECISHLEKRTVGAIEMQQVRGGGFYKYCDMIARGWKSLTRLVVRQMFVTLLQVVTVNTNMLGPLHSINLPQVAPYDAYADLHNIERNLATYIRRHYPQRPCESLRFVACLQSCVSAITALNVNNNTLFTCVENDAVQLINISVLRLTQKLQYHMHVHNIAMPLPVRITQKQKLKEGCPSNISTNSNNCNGSHPTTNLVPSPPKQGRPLMQKQTQNTYLVQMQQRPNVNTSRMHLPKTLNRTIPLLPLHPLIKYLTQVHARPSLQQPQYLCVTPILPIRNIQAQAQAVANAATNAAIAVAKNRTRVKSHTAPFVFNAMKLLQYVVKWKKRHDQDTQQPDRVLLRVIETINTTNFKKVLHVFLKCHQFARHLFEIEEHRRRANPNQTCKVDLIADKFVLLNDFQFEKLDDTHKRLYLKRLYMRILQIVPCSVECNYSTDN